MSDGAVGGVSRESGRGAVSVRDPRVDVLRGFALLTIFVDHIPGDDLNHFTMRNLGFSDAAELFVLLAGFASWMAYGGTFDRQGTVAGLKRIAMRCARLYLFQIGTLLATLLVVVLWTNHFHLAVLNLQPLIGNGVRGVARGLNLSTQPAYLNILPLYIVLLMLFPLIYAAIRVGAWLALGLSACLWYATHLYPQINLTNTMDGLGWFFNPFAWQFLFVIGAFGAMLVKSGRLVRNRAVVTACVVYLIVACLESAPWRDWGLPNLAPSPVPVFDKTNLSAFRLLHVVAFAYVVLTWPGLTDALRSRFLAPMTRAAEACGRHSLEVFTLGTMLALFGRLAFRTWGFSWPMQIGVNASGLVMMVLLGLALEQGRARQLRGNIAGKPAARVRRLVSVGPHLGIAQSSM